MIDYAVRVIQPGIWIDDALPQRGEAQTLIDELVSQMVNANIALNLFDEARAQSHSATQAYFAAMRQGPRSGMLMPKRPNRLITQKPFLCARMFVFALDHIRRTLHSSVGVSGGLAAIDHKFFELFPGLKGARDSAHHRDERLRGLGKNKKPIRPKAVQIQGMITAPAGAIIMIDGLDGTSFTCTAESGDIVQVDVSLASLQKVQTVVQEVINLFQWKGPQMSRPD